MKKGILYFFLVLFCCCNLSYAYSKTDLDLQTQKLIEVSGATQNQAIDVTALIKIAKARNEFLRQEISNPSLFVKFLLPNKITQKLPSEVQPFLEKEMTNLEGKLTIRAALIQDAKGTKDVIQYVLNKGGAIYYLHFITPPTTLNLKSDAIINVKRAFQIPSGTKEAQLVVDPNDVVIVKDINAQPYAFGPQKTLAILLNFRNQPTNQPWTKAEIANTLFTETNDIFYESSYKQTTITGQVVGYFTLNLDSTAPCTSIENDLPTLANQLVASAGIDITQYNRRVYIFPRSTCGWGALGDVGGQYTQLWINGYPQTRIFAHEMGHNVGLYHSRSITCPNSPNEGSCTINEYGDGSDVMGNGDIAHYNALQKDRLGWLNYQTSPPITTVTTSGSYFIDVYETANNKPKALKVRKSPTSPDFYYLEFRQPIGFDSEFGRCGTDCDYSKGIVFHQGNPTSGDTDLLDMTPGGGPRLVSLYPCKSWKSGNITFSVDSISTKGAKVSVVFGPESKACNHTTPTLTYSMMTPYAKEGEKVLYAIHIKNNDDKNCKPLDFVMTPQNVSPLVKTMLSKDALRIEPGKTKQVNLEVIPQKLPSGIYPIKVSVKNGIDDKHTALANLTLGVNQ